MMTDGRRMRSHFGIGPFAAAAATATIDGSRRTLVTMMARQSWRRLGVSGLEMLHVREVDAQLFAAIVGQTLAAQLKAHFFGFFGRAKEHVAVEFVPWPVDFDVNTL